MIVLGTHSTSFVRRFWWAGLNALHIHGLLLFALLCGGPGKNINARPHVWDAFDFSEISSGHLSNLGCAGAGLYAGEVGYFKDETKGDPIVLFVGLLSMMYSFNVCEASEPIPGLNYPINVRHKAVAKDVARSKIRRFKHEDYVRMYNGGDLTNVVNRRIGSKLN